MKRTTGFLALLCVGFLPLDPPAHQQYSPNHSAMQESGPPTQRAPTQKGTRLYIIRVIDTQSKAPVNKAKVAVALDNPSRTKWTGYTDSKGVFQFKWDAITQSVKAHISIQAQGFMTLDDYNQLIEDRIIPLIRAD